MGHHHQSTRGRRLPSSTIAVWFFLEGDEGWDRSGGGEEREGRWREMEERVRRCERERRKMTDLVPELRRERRSGGGRGSGVKWGRARKWKKSIRRERSMGGRKWKKDMELDIRTKGSRWGNQLNVICEKRGFRLQISTFSIQFEFKELLTFLKISKDN